MEKEIKLIIKNAKSDLEKVTSDEELKIFKSKYLNKNDDIAKIQRVLVSEKDKNRKAKIGQLLNEYRKNVNLLLLNKKEEINLIEANKEIGINLIDPSSDLQYINGTSFHPLNLLKNEIIDFFQKKGYSFISAPIIETQKYNFDKLNLDKFHPAREMQDSFYLNNNKLLRTHATNATARTIEKTKFTNTKTIAIGKVFRNDEDDQTHHHQFNQIDILDLGKDANLLKLKNILEEFAKFIFDNKTMIRFRPSYFPFTEPSLEMDVKSNLIAKDKWIEILGCGLVNEKVIELSNKNPKDYSGFAIGIGLERIAMLKWGISDIRDLYNGNISFLKSFKEVI